MKPNIDDILLLPDEERLEIMEKIRQSFDTDNKADVPAWHMKIIKECLEDYDKNPSEGKPWDEVKESILGK